MSFFHAVHKSCGLRLPLSRLPLTPPSAKPEQKPIRRRSRQRRHLPHSAKQCLLRANLYSCAHRKQQGTKIRARIRNLRLVIRVLLHAPDCSRQPGHLRYLPPPVLLHGDTPFQSRPWQPSGNGSTMERTTAIRPSAASLARSQQVIHRFPYFRKFMAITHTAQSPERVSR